MAIILLIILILQGLPTNARGGNQAGPRVNPRSSGGYFKTFSRTQGEGSQQKLNLNPQRRQWWDFWVSVLRRRLTFEFDGPTFYWSHWETLSMSRKRDMPFYLFLYFVFSLVFSWRSISRGLRAPEVLQIEIARKAHRTPTDITIYYLMMTKFDR